MRHVLLAIGILGVIGFAGCEARVTTDQTPARVDVDVERKPADVDVDVERTPGGGVDIDVERK
jgi:hypothetical protein